jgi:ribosomal protein S18 acetylase RimI-like enzyme
MSAADETHDPNEEPHANAADGSNDVRVKVRRAVRGDLEQAAALAARLVHQHHEVDPRRFFLPADVERGYVSWFARELGRREAVVLVAAAGDEVVGYCYGTLEDRDWNLLLDRHGAIHDILVADAGRRRGTGAALLAAMVSELEALGAQRIVLSTMVGNTNAQRLFESAGFRPTMLEMTRG